MVYTTSGILKISSEDTNWTVSLLHVCNLVCEDSKEWSYCFERQGTKNFTHRRITPTTVHGKYGGAAAIWTLDSKLNPMWVRKHSGKEEENAMEVRVI